jgi:hypothetical protein
MREYAAKPGWTIAMHLQEVGLVHYNQSAG